MKNHKYINLSEIAGVKPNNKVTKVNKPYISVVQIQGGGSASDEVTQRAYALKARFEAVKKEFASRGVRFSRHVWATDAIDKALADLEKTLNLS
jgi:hypothetical protein